MLCPGHQLLWPQPPNQIVTPRMPQGPADGPAHEQHRLGVVRSCTWALSAEPESEGRGSSEVWGASLWCSEPQEGLGIRIDSRSTSGRARFLFTGSCRNRVSSQLSASTVAVAHTAETRGRRGAPGCGRVVGRRVEDGCFRPRLPAAPLITASVLFHESFTFPAERTSPAC